MSGTFSLPNPLSPATSDPLTSAPIRQNFQAIQTQINNADGAALVAGSVPVTALANADGWLPLTPSVSAITANGNRSYNVTYTSSLAATLQPGMRLRLTRAVAAPTQSTLLNGTTQFYSKAAPNAMTFTNNFVVSAWIKMTSYAIGTVASRWNGSNGWVMRISATGQLEMFGTNTTGANFKDVQSYQSIPLNKWVHVTAQLDMTSSTCSPTVNYIMFDGVDIPCVQTTGGTNPTSLIQAGNLEIGSNNGGLQPFPGKIAQLAIYSAKVTQATILSSMNQSLVGTETSLISAYSFNNSTSDLSGSANNLAANGGAVATSADSPFAQAATAGLYEYGIVQAVSGAVVTLQVAEGCALPTIGTVVSSSYSAQRTPFGFPGQRDKWSVICVAATDTSNQSIGALNTFFNNPYQTLNVPIGSWVLTNQGAYAVTGTVAGGITYNLLFGTSSSSRSIATTLVNSRFESPSTTSYSQQFYRSAPITIAAQTIHYTGVYVEAAGGTVNWRMFAGAVSDFPTFSAENAYL